MHTFRIVLTSDFFDRDGSLVYPGYNLSPLEDDPNVEIDVLPEGVRVHAEQIDDIDVLISSPMSIAITAESFPASGRLALIARNGAGYDDVDVDAATENGVAIAVAKESVRRSVAVATLALMFALTTRLVDKHKLAVMGPEGWARRDGYGGVGLTGKKLGIIGMGNIGAEVFRLAAPLDMKFMACDPYADVALAQSLGVRLVDLDTLLREADIVTIHCPLTDETRGLIDAQRLALMKPTAYLINTARGPVLDQQALVEALRSRRIAGAGLDVFVKEPTDADDPILKLDNVVLSPHALNWTDECCALIGEENVRAVLDVMHGREPHGILNRAVFENESWRRKLAAYRDRFGARESGVG